MNDETNQTEEMPEVDDLLDALPVNESVQEEAEEVAEVPVSEQPPAQEPVPEATVARRKRGATNYIPMLYIDKAKPFTSRKLSIDVAKNSGTFTFVDGDGKERTYNFDVDELSVN